MAADAAIPETSTVVADPENSVVFFGESNLAYNWKTKQWTRQPAWDGLDYFPPNKLSLTTDSAAARYCGLLRFQNNTVDLQTGHVQTIGMAQEATITTAAVDPNQGGRCVVNGVRPLVNEVTGSSVTVRAGVQDHVGTAVSWSTSTSLNSRTKMANFRSEGRWVRTEITLTSGFNTVWGADIEFASQGRV